MFDIRVSGEVLDRVLIRIEVAWARGTNAGLRVLRPNQRIACAKNFGRRGYGPQRRQHELRMLCPYMFQSPGVRLEFLATPVDGAYESTSVRSWGGHCGGNEKVKKCE